MTGVCDVEAMTPAFAARTGAHVAPLRASSRGDKSFSLPTPGAVGRLDRLVGRAAVMKAVDGASSGWDRPWDASVRRSGCLSSSSFGLAWRAQVSTRGSMHPMNRARSGVVQRRRQRGPWNERLTVADVWGHGLSNFTLVDSLGVHHAFRASSIRCETIVPILRNSWTLAKHAIIH